MKTISIGKYYGLQRISGQHGTFTCLALDHRQNLRRSINPENPVGVSSAKLVEFKLSVTDALADGASAVLLDPEYSAAHAVRTGVIPNNVGLIVALEATGYMGAPAARYSQILPGWSVEKAKRMGANAIKLLVYYHPAGETVIEIEDLIARVADDCREYDLVFMLEPIIYSLKDGDSLPPSQKSEIIIETATRLSPLGIDILKVEFPMGGKVLGDDICVKACKELSKASVVPWVLLSGAVNFDKYLAQVEIACKAGASGIAVGRAVWKEAISLTGADRNKFFKTIGRERLATLRNVCDLRAKPYTDFYISPVPSDWYKRYGENDDQTV